jgi:hypothetical protein
MIVVQDRKQARVAAWLSVSAEGNSPIRARVGRGEAGVKDFHSGKVNC